MMLTVLYPEIMPVIQQMPFGILPESLTSADEDYQAFIVKAPKELLLTAKINEGFKLYLIPVKVGSHITLGLITAFFDDEDEPLVIKTPLFLEDFSHNLFSFLKKGMLNVHFFDELTRELLVYRADVIIPDKTLKKINEAVLLKPSLSNARKILRAIEIAFSSRTKNDDEQAIDIILSTAIYGDNIFRQDMHPKRHSYHGSPGHSHTMLERQEPGSYQEEDIIQCLLLTFQPEQIFLNPKRTYDNEEMCDILIITNTTSLIIQAKDSPNIERISRQKLPRKRKNVLSALKKATAQVNGAISYYRRIPGKLEFLIDEVLHSVDTNSLELKALIVVKELFNDQSVEFSPQLLDIYKAKNVPCIAFGYPDFYQFCFNLKNEDAFFNAHCNVMENAKNTGVFPQVSFW
ncbi:hypothetical protein MK852_16140 [Shewanella benthica]|uniref:hypothetical protein n=1 Tax=Shewanella benthica TaxID=43661 RepID=UPI00187A660F|nr:hypothetical protein [Shewanella benthica]MBE7215949.1 hypothetical protein [Shewanella benthica]MCL1063641.1 hypothetical protein [Shewanella benthica]